jgi:hypothetical protein
MVHVAHIGPNGMSTYATLHKTKADCNIGNHNCLLSLVHVRPFSAASRDRCQISIRYWKKIPDPFLGPKGVRTLLVFRGFCGCESPLVACAQSYEFSVPCHRFMGLCGVYFSLQYLSLSDATVLTFLIPTFTGFSGALFLKEPFSPRELLTGCTYATSSFSFQLTRGQYSALLESS